jgi:hypothetical protein
MKLRETIITLSAIVVLISSARAIGGDLNVSYLEFSPEIRELIRQHVPDDLRADLIANLNPEVYSSFFKVSEYRRTATDSSSGILLVYLTNGEGLATLQMYHRTSGHWTFVSENRKVREGYPASIGYSDVNCDGVNEILLTGLVGAGGNTHVDVLGIRGDSLQSLTAALVGTDLFGRSVSFKKTGDCEWELEVTEDGPDKFVGGERKLYRLDQSSKTYKLVSDEKVQQK